MEYYKYNKGDNSKAKKSFALGPTPFSKKHDNSKAFEIKRPAFKSGSITISEPPLDIDIKNKRTGINNEIVRNSFRAPKIIGRQADTFSSVQIMKPSNIFELGEKTLSKLIDVKVPDITDKKWLDEAARRRSVIRNEMIRKSPGITEAELDFAIEEEFKINPPLGREQRMKIKRTAIGSTSQLGPNKALDEILQEIKEGRADAANDKAQLLMELVKIFTEANKNDAILQAIVEQKQTLDFVLARLGAKALSREALFGTAQKDIVGKTWVAGNIGVLTLYLYSYVEMQKPYLSYRKPLFNMASENKDNSGALNGTFSLSATAISNLNSKLNENDAKKKNFFNLATRALLKPGQVLFLKDEAKAAGTGDIIDPSLSGGENALIDSDASKALAARIFNSKVPFPNTTNIDKATFTPTDDKGLR